MTREGEDIHTCTRLHQSRRRRLRLSGYGSEERGVCGGKFGGEVSWGSRGGEGSHQLGARHSHHPELNNLVSSPLSCSSPSPAASPNHTQPTENAINLLLVPLPTKSPGDVRSSRAAKTEVEEPVKMKRANKMRPLKVKPGVDGYRQGMVRV